MAAPASAGGGVIVQDGDLDVAVQHTAATYAAGQVELVVDFTLDGAADADSGALLLIATPTEPAIAQASEADIAALEATDTVSEPAIVTSDQWWPDAEFFSGTQVEAVEAPDSVGFDDGGVHALGPAGADGVIGWLSSVAFPADSDSQVPIRTYGDAGWYFTALTFAPPTEDGLTLLPALKITFPADALVVPLMMGSSSSGSYTVRTSVVGEQRLDRTDQLRGLSNIEFAGEVTSGDQPGLATWLEPYGGTGWVTTVSQVFTNPGRITQDLTFAPSDYGAVTPDPVTEIRRRIIFGIPAGLVLLGGALIAVALGGIGLSLFLQRRDAD